MYLQRLYYVASVPTHLFFFFKYLPSTSTNRLVQHLLLPTSMRLFCAPVYACLRACSSAYSAFSAHSSNIFSQCLPPTPHGISELSERQDRPSRSALLIPHPGSAKFQRSRARHHPALPTATAPFPAQRRWGGLFSASPSISISDLLVFSSIPDIKAHSCDPPVITEEADMDDQIFFSAAIITAILPVIWPVTTHPISLFAWSCCKISGR